MNGRTYPVVLPTWRDPRLHLAAVIVSIHVIGIGALGFDVSIPQILSAILVCAVIEVGWTLWRSGALVWPASAMLTGSGVALILRAAGTESGDLWSWHRWYLFAAIAAAALFSKYLIRFQGTHVFNPSNIALVVAFLILGSGVVEPLDFWWAPLNGWMLAGYAIILAGGVLITGRLGLLPMAAAFWVALAAGLGLLASSGHCFTARWALEPVCGSQFWWVVVLSPEILIFLFFMITDPKTIPRGRTAQIAFAMAIAVLAVLLIAPQTTEFGAKVALLAALVLLSPLRSLFNRVAVRASAPATGGPAWSGRLVRGSVALTAVAGLAVLVVAAGTPARQPAAATPATAAAGAGAIALPPVSLDPSLDSVRTDLDFAEEAPELAAALVTNLQAEADAIRSGDASRLEASLTGGRLVAMRQRIQDDAAEGQRVVADYQFDTLHLRVVPVAGGQGSDLGFDATGEIHTVAYDGAGQILGTSSAPFASIFVLRTSDGVVWRTARVIEEAAQATGTVVAAGPVVTVPGDYPSITAAVAEAPDRAVVAIAPGRYFETVTIARPITLRGSGDVQLIGDGRGPVIEIAGTSNVTIEGLGIVNGRVGVLVDRSEGVRIIGNEIADNELRGIHVVNASAVITGNLVRDTHAPYGIGIHLANSSARPRSVVENNVVEDNGRAGIATNFTNAVIRDNTVRGNGGRGIAVTEMSVANVVGNQVGGNGGTEVLVIDGSNATLQENTIEATPGGALPIPVLVEFNARANLVGNTIGPRSWCAVSIGFRAAVTGGGNVWAGDPFGCDPVPFGLFVR